MEKLMLVVGALLFAVALGALYAFTGTLLWWWFIYPLIGIGAPSIVTMYGLFMFVSLFNGSTPDNKEGTDIKSKVVYSVVKPCILLLFGFILRGFV